MKQRQIYIKKRFDNGNHKCYKIVWTSKQLADIWLSGLPDKDIQECRKMIQNGENEKVINKLKNKLLSWKERVRALEVAISVLEEGEDEHPEILSTRSEIQFVTSTIPEATEQLILKAGRPLHVTEIVKGLKDGAFRFRNPRNAKRSVPGALLNARNKGKTRIKNIGKNTFSLPEVERHRSN